MPELTWTETVKPHLENNYELKKLWKEHGQLEKELAELDQIKWLTTEQELTRNKLQKQKLQGKDRMMEIVRELGPPEAQAA